MRATPEISYRQAVTAGSTFQWHGIGGNACFLVWHIQPVQWTQSVISREDYTMLKLADKVTTFKAKLELWAWGVNMGLFDTFQALAEILKETEPVFFVPVGAWAPISVFKGVWALLPNSKRSQAGKEWIHDPSVNKPNESTLSVLSFSCCHVWLFGLQPKLTHGLQHARLCCPSTSPRVCSNSCPLTW